MANQGSIELVFQLDQSDIARGNADVAFGKLTPYKWVVIAASSAVFTEMFVVLIFPQMQGSGRWEELVAAGVVGLVVWPALLLVTVRWNASRTAKDLLKNSPALRGPTRWSFSDAGIQVSGPTGNSNVEWKAFIKAQETEPQFLLYPYTHIAYVIPKRYFAGQEEIRDFREMLRRNVSEAKLRAIPE